MDGTNKSMFVTSDYGCNNTLENAANFAYTHTSWSQAYTENYANSRNGEEESLSSKGAKLIQTRIKKSSLSDRS